MQVLQQLIAQDNTVIVIEHHPEVIRRADQIFDLGPEGGAGGGHLVACGNLDQIMAAEGSHTGAMLRDLFT
jgi:excinuclease ABC subunit A